MLTLDEIARQLSGVWKMARGAPDWRQTLERDTEGVFRSGYALALSAPLTLLATMLARRAAIRAPETDAAQLASVPPIAAAAFNLADFGLVWAGSLALLLAIARRTERTRAAADIVVGWNWLQPVTIAAGLPSIALASAGLDVAAVGFALLALIFSVGLYFGFIRRAFDAEAGAAIGIVFLLVMIEIIVDFLALGVAQSIYGSP